MAFPTFQALGTQNAGLSNSTPNWPAHLTNDVGLLILETTGGQPLVSIPGAWAQVANSPQATGATTTGTQLTVLWRRAASAAETDPVLSIVGANHLFSQIITFRGCATSGDPWDVTAGNVKAVASTALSIPGVNTTVADCLVVVIATRDTDAGTAWTSNWANGTLANLTPRYDANSTTGNGGGLALTTGELASPGATGTTTLDLAASCVNAFLVVALRPPVGGGGGVGQTFQSLLVSP